MGNARSRRIVVKCGTSLLASPKSGLNVRFTGKLARQVQELMHAGCQVVLVTSGAVAMGRAILGDSIPESTVSRQMLAAVGQAPLMAVFSRAFKRLDIIVAQTLLSRAALEDRSGYLNARNTFLALLDHGVLPVANENDVVATEELHFGDNDNLSALIANLVDADTLVILTNVDGYLLPDHDGQPRLVPEVHRVTDEMIAAAGEWHSPTGTGGMKTKLEAARLATAHGATAMVINGHLENGLVRVARGERLGTRFHATGFRRESRKRWLLTDLALRGKVHIDPGAVAALVKFGRSLLPAGVQRVDGPFGRGDLLEVIGPDGRVVAHGLSNYSSRDLERIIRHASSDIGSILGYEFGAEVIHRNNLVLVPAPVSSSPN